MEIRKMEENNLCECYHEELGYSVWVQSDNTGLWFNMNDIIRTFNLSKANKRWIKKTSGENNIIVIEFDRFNDEGISREYFISEHMVHEVISLNRKETRQAEQFIYSIIKDYDENVSTNEMYYNTEERIALNILSTDYNKFLYDHQEQFDILKDTPIIYDFQELKDFIDWELEGCHTEYCKKRVPEDIREEERKEKMKQRSEVMPESNKSQSWSDLVIFDDDEFDWGKKIKEINKKYYNM